MRTFTFRQHGVFLPLFFRSRFPMRRGERVSFQFSGHAKKGTHQVRNIFCGQLLSFSLSLSISFYFAHTNCRRIPYRHTHTRTYTLLYAIAAAPHQRGTLYTHRHTRAHPFACRKSGKSWQIFFSLSRCGAKGLFYSLAKKERLLDEIEFKSRNS